MAVQLDGRPSGSALSHWPPVEQGHAQAPGRCHGDQVALHGRAVRSQERAQRREHLFRSLLGNPVADAWNDHSLYVVRGDIPDRCTPAGRPADR